MYHENKYGCLVDNYSNNYLTVSTSIIVKINQECEL